MEWKKTGAREWRLKGEVYAVQIHQVYEYGAGSYSYTGGFILQ